MSRPFVLVFALVASVATAQSRLYTFDGDAPGDALGRAVAGAGDVDGDGIPDLIVGEPENDTNGAEAGLARVLSGATGLPIWTFYGAAGNFRFGHSVAGAGDVNADGYADVIVGAIGDDTSILSSGAARVFSGLDGTQLHEFYGVQLFGFFGFHVDGAGDFNADGYDDVIVAGPALVGPGQGKVYSGRDGSVLLQFLTEGFGELVAGAGDVDRDGFADIVLGSPQDTTNGTGAGKVRIVSGRTHLTLYEFFGAAGDELGVAVAGAGDVNGDGYDDVIAGSRQLFSAGMGRAAVYSGIDGAVLGTFTGTIVGEQYGTSVDGAGDVDGDGLDDVIVGIWGADYAGVNAGRAIVYSVVSATVLLTLDGDSAGDELGISVAGAGDVDDDGFADVIVGAQRDDDNGVDAGRAFVEDAGFTGAPSRERFHSAGCPSSVGTPRIDFRGRARLTTTVELRLRGAKPSTPAVLLLGSPLVTPLDPFGMTGCTAYANLNGLTAWAFTDVDGLAGMPVHIPNAPIWLLGNRLDFQWAALDLGVNPGGVVVSNALAATFGPP